MILLAVLLSAGTVAIHAAARFVGQPLPLALLAGAQLGVPVAAVAIGTRSQLLMPGEGGAILVAALLSIGITSIAAAAAQRAPSPTVPTASAK